MKIELELPSVIQMVDKISHHFDDPEMINFLDHGEICDFYSQVRFCELGITDFEIISFPDE